VGRKCLNGANATLQLLACLPDTSPMTRVETSQYPKAVVNLLLDVCCIDANVPHCAEFVVVLIGDWHASPILFVRQRAQLSSAYPSLFLDSLLYSVDSIDTPCL
jgi:hypothetical protein